MVVIWNARTGVPVRTIFEVHPGGCIDLDISPDAMYVCTLGSGDVQGLSVWDWTVERDDPLATSEIASKDLQHCVRFRRDDVHEIVSNGSVRTIFWNWSDGDTNNEEEEGTGRTRGLLKFYSPAISAKEFLTPVGNFTQSVFIPGSTQAVTATEDGDLVLWDQVLLPALHARPSDRCAIKLLKLHDGHSIRVVAVFDKFLVTAATDGFVRFYDFKFRLLAWYEDLDVGPITRLTFTSPRAPLDKMAMEVCAYFHTCAHTQTHTHANTHTNRPHTHRHRHRHRHTNTQTQGTQTYRHKHTHTHTQTHYHTHKCKNTCTG